MTADKFRLDGRVAVVTGASKNIGLEIARAFAHAGGTVVMVAREALRLEDQAQRVRQESGSRIEIVVADAATVDGANHIERTVLDQFPQADILVNNAYAFGDTLGKHILEIPDAEWEATFQGNVLGPFRLCRSLGRKMLAGRGGSIINLLSGAAFQPSPRLSPYGCSKAALWSMTRYLSRELAPKIRVNAICPGIIGHELADVSSIPMGRVGNATEVAPAALYLASDAASYTTGTVLFVNGGRPW